MGVVKIYSRCLLVCKPRLVESASISILQKEIKNWLVVCKRKCRSYLCVELTFDGRRSFKNHAQRWQQFILAMLRTTIAILRNLLQRIENITRRQRQTSQGLRNITRSCFRKNNVTLTIRMKETNLLELTLLNSCFRNFDVH